MRIITPKMRANDAKTGVCVPYQVLTLLQETCASRGTFYPCISVILLYLGFQSMYGIPICVYFSDIIRQKKRISFVMYGTYHL
jgi:hypothetical protein